VSEGRLRFAFAGTPEFAAWTLSDLAGLGRVPELVISQPDRPRGRGRHVLPSAVAQASTDAGLRHISTLDINDPSVLAELQAARADMLVIAAFGQLLKPELLAGIPCINVHASLLPAYRGAAPIVRAIQAGEDETGVSIMKVTLGLDEGPWASQTRISISMRDDTGGLGRTLAFLGARGVDQVLTGIADGTVSWREQEGHTNYASKIGPADRRLDISRSARAAHDQVRSLSPGPGVEAASGLLSLKLWRTWPWQGDDLLALDSKIAEAAGTPGRLVRSDSRLFCGCGHGVLEVLRIQPAGKKAMEIADFLRGYAGRLGGEIGPPSASNQGGTHDGD
jgi:methionyl-tRNA formyltransferase